MHDVLKLKGELHIVLTDADGNVKLDKVVPNMITTAGKNFLFGALGALTSSTIGYMALGTDSTPVNTGQTTLITEVDRRAVTPTIGSGTATYTYTFTPGQGTGALTEAGLFSASSGGTMFSRTVFDIINKASTDSLTITWIISGS